MVSSGGASGGGGGKPPTQPTPSGQITGFGAATPADPQFNSVLTNGMGWADVGEIDAANDANANATAQRAQLARAAPAMGAGMGGMDAFAQQLLDYNKQRNFSQGLMSMGGPFARYGIQGMRAPAPVASNPTQQLMLQALQQRQVGGGRPSGGYSGGGGHLR